MPALASSIERRTSDDTMQSSPSSPASSPPPTTSSLATASPHLQSRSAVLLSHETSKLYSFPETCCPEATCYHHSESRSLVRYPAEEMDETARTNSGSTVSTTSSCSKHRCRQSLPKISPSLRSLVRSRSRRQNCATSASLLDNGESRNCKRKSYLQEDIRDCVRRATGLNEEADSDANTAVSTSIYSRTGAITSTAYTTGITTTTTTTITTTAINPTTVNNDSNHHSSNSNSNSNSSNGNNNQQTPSAKSSDNNNIQDVSSSMSNVAFVGAIPPTVTSSRISRGTSSVVRATGVLTTPGPSTSSWNSSNEQESDYVVDPVQGNAYYKGQFLGKGGFARVYLMTDVSNGNQYACKIIPKNRMQKIHMQKIAREIVIHKELNHVNVVQMHHYFEDNLNVYMLLEACPRKSLMHVLRYRGKVTEPEARYYMKQMVTGVAYIHSQKVIHRDLKPGNMFLSDRMIVKIGDFGLAMRSDGQRRRVTICGTPNFIAPEVLYKQAYSYEADVWALGCILYALLVGQPPFDTATLKETYARICNNHYRELDDSIASRSGQDLIRWLLQPNPELRPSLERVKEHAYLTKEYVPSSLPHTCCYQMPHLSLLERTSSPSSVSTGVVRNNQEMAKNQLWQNPVPQSDFTLRTQQQQQPQQQPQQQHQQVGIGMQYQHLNNRSQKNLQKDSKVSNWLARKLPKLPRFKQRLSNVLCPDHKKVNLVAQSVQMHRALDNCVEEMYRNSVERNPPCVEDVVPLFITKWIDYSNKYGLGFQLSDRSVGVLFNDNTKISYTYDRRKVEYMTIDDEVTRYHRERDIPVNLQKKLELLRHFTQYMDDFLTEGGEVKKCHSTIKPSKNAYVPRMRRWLRTDQAIVMELTVPILQVNFFVDHTKMIVSQEAGKAYLITYIDTARRVSSYWLNDIRDYGCTRELYERLYYVCEVTREFAELDNSTIIQSNRAD